MKAITLYQPWASLWASGIKRAETRSWPFPFVVRDRVIAIHAAKKWSREMASMCLGWPYAPALAALGIEDPADLPRGAIVGTCRLLWSRQIADNPANQVVESDPESVVEDGLGDYSIGRWAWEAEGHRKIVCPIPYTGAQGFFEVPDVSACATEMVVGRPAFLRSIFEAKPDPAFALRRAGVRL